MSISATAQTVGSTKTEQYKASFETAIDIERFLDYEGKQIPIQILKAGISDEMYEMYPELKEKRVGLGVANPEPEPKLKANDKPSSEPAESVTLGLEDPDEPTWTLDVDFVVGLGVVGLGVVNVSSTFFISFPYPKIHIASRI